MAKIKSRLRLCVYTKLSLCYRPGIGGYYVAMHFTESDFAHHMWLRYGSGMFIFPNSAN